MSGWQKVNVAGSEDDNTFVLFMSDLETKLAAKIGWTAPGDRNGRWAAIIDHGKIAYAEVETELQAVTVSGGEYLSLRHTDRTFRYEVVCGMCFADGTSHPTSNPWAVLRLGLPQVQDCRLTDFLPCVISGCDVELRLHEHGRPTHHGDCLPHSDGLQELPDWMGHRHRDADDVPP